MTDLNTNTDHLVQIIKNARLNDIRPGDHITWMSAKKMGGLGGVTSKKIREGIAHLRDAHGDWWTEDGARITDSKDKGGTVTITIRRPRGLPEREGAVIVRKGERIEARHAGKTWVATEAVLVDWEWRGTWFDKSHTASGFSVMWAMAPDRITPGTWKEANQ